MSFADQLQGALVEAKVRIVRRGPRPERPEAKHPDHGIKLGSVIEVTSVLRYAGGQGGGITRYKKVTSEPEAVSDGETMFSVGTGKTRQSVKLLSNGVTLLIYGSARSSRKFELEAVHPKGYKPSKPEPLSVQPRRASKVKRRVRRAI